VERMSKDRRTGSVGFSAIGDDIAVAAAAARCC
jgi:hypothetical protein